MKKKLLFIIPLFSLLIAGCNGGGEETSASTTSSPTTSSPTTSGGTSGTSGTTSASSTSSTSSPVVQKHTVRFLVDGVVVHTVEVNHGDYVTPPANPTKAPDAEACKYVFAGWDRDLEIPIIRDVDFNATFDGYANELLVDDFESYTVANELADNGWFAIGYGNDGKWTKETSASVSLSENAADGSQALRFDSYKNSSPFMIRKEFEENTFNKCTNAIKFKMMTPNGANISRFLIDLPVEDPNTGLIIDATIKHDFPVTTAEYFECIIPFASDGWKLWDTPIDLKEDTKAYGVNCDRIPTMMTQLQFCLRYPNYSPSNYLAFLDSVSFVTIDESITEVQVKDYVELSNRYVGKTLQGETIRLDVNTETKDATATIIDRRTPLVVNGTVAKDGNQLTFTSSTEGELTYVGHLTNGGQKLEYVSATGDLKNTVAEMKMDAVQVVDNFEQYEVDGEIYHAGNSESDRSGCRGNYYAEYYKGEGATAPWGKGGWSLMEGDHNQLSMGSDGGHSGNNYLKLKRGSAVLRYMQWNLSKGTTDTNAYRGNTFSFWARKSGTGSINHIKMYFYYQSSPTISTMDSYVKTLDLFEEIPDVWTHYTIKLDSEQVYYGFLVNVYGNDTTTSYLLLDDLEVYTANPYSTCAEGVSLDKTTASLAVGFQEELFADFDPVDTGNKNINWTTSDSSIATVSSKGVVTAVSTGNATITATTVDGGFTATCDVAVTDALSYPEGTYKGNVTIGEDTYNFVISTGRYKSSALTVVAANLNNVDAKAFAISYDGSTGAFSITTSGSFGDKTFGTISGTYNATTNSLINVSFAGTLGATVTNNGTLALSKLTTNECNGTKAQLQAMFRRRYKTNWSNWQIDTTNDDRFAKNTNAVTGGVAVKLRANQGVGNATSISLAKDFRTPKKVSSMQFWVNNPGANDIYLSVWVYKGEGYQTAIEIASNNDHKATAVNRNDMTPANSYVYICLSFDECEIYNWQIAEMAAGTASTSDVPLSFDNIVVF